MSSHYLPCGPDFSSAAPSLRKYVAHAVLAASCFAALAGCNPSGSSNPAGSSGTSSTGTSSTGTSSAPPTAGKAGDGTGNPAYSAITLVEPGKLTVCTHLSFKPFEFKDGSGKVVGFDIDLANLVAKKLGVTTQIVDIDFASQTSGAVFAARKCDMSVAGTTINDKRRQAIQFSMPYFNSTQALLVKKGSGFKDLADLKGRKLGVQSDTTGQEYAKKNLSANGYELVVFDDLPTLVNGLKAGRVDAAINDNGPLLDFAKDNADTAVVAEFATGEQYGMAVQKDNANATKLMAVIDEVINGSLKDGSYKQIYKTWFGAEPTQLPTAR